MGPILAAAGRGLTQCFSSAKSGFAKLTTPRGPNGHLPGGAAAAGGSSPMDMLGNVANVAGVGMQGYQMLGGGGPDKPKAPEKTGTPYESQL